LFVDSKNFHTVKYKINSTIPKEKGKWQKGKRKENTASGETQSQKPGTVPKYDGETTKKILDENKSLSLPLYIDS